MCMIIIISISPVITDIIIISTVVILLPLITFSTTFTTLDHFKLPIIIKIEQK